MIKYVDADKSAVIKNELYIPRTHRFWQELGIQSAEEAGEIMAHDFRTEDEMIQDAYEKAEDFYLSEKAIAVIIEEDYRLDLADVTEQEMVEVKTYIKSIKPVMGEESPSVVRPEIMSNYSTK